MINQLKAQKIQFYCENCIHEFVREKEALAIECTVIVYNPSKIQVQKPKCPYDKKIQPNWRIDISL